MDVPVIADPVVPAPAPPALARGWPVRAAAAIVLTIALLALVGWVVDSPALKGVVPRFSTMKANTALCLALLGAALGGLAAPAVRRGHWLFARAVAVVVGLIAGATLLEHVTGRSFGIDQLVFVDAGPAHGRMASITAVNFLLFALGLALRTTGRKCFRRSAEWPVLAGGFVTSVAITAYLFGQSAAFAFDATLTIAVHTAFCFACLTAGLLMLRRDEGLVGVLVQPLAGGFMARRLFPLAFLLPTAAGWLALEGERQGWYSHGLGLALFASVCAWTLARLIRFTGENVNRIDATQQGALAALRESEERFHNLFDHTSDLVQCVAPDGRFLFVNPAWHRMLGYTPAELPGLRIFDVIAPECHGHCREMFERVMRGESIDALVVQFLARDGRVVHLEGNTHCQFAAGRPVATRAILRDSTARRAAEAAMMLARDAALESARVKSEFLANMSHEIRTPMNGVLGMLHLLDDAQLSPEQRDFVGTARSSAESLLVLLDDILDLSKIEAGKLVIEEADFNPREIVESALELLADRAQSKGLELIGAFDPWLPQLVRGDATRLRQVLFNLVGNAIKFTHEGEVVVGVRTIPADAGARLEFEVRDTGIGIPGEVQRKLFQPFTQADGSTTRKYGGTGLGLVISRRLVELMGGEIHVASEPGRGSVFTFALRVRPAAVPPPPAALPARLGGRRVLVVDDNATNRSVLRHQLTGWGMRHTEAAEAATALELLRAAAASDPFPVALLDLQMPGMDGLELARAIKADPAIAATRLVILTSLGTRLDAATREAAGIDECLLKPVRLARLQEAIAHCLGEARRPAPRVGAPGLRVAVPRRPLRILVAEDNVVNQKVTLGQLRKLGYTADIAANGREAVAAHARAAYDVVLMDCEMPEMEGYEATRRIRAAERAAPGTPAKPVHIIALTAHALAGARAVCLEAGMDDYLSKPMNPAALAAALERVPAGTPGVSLECLSP